MERQTAISLAVKRGIHNQVVFFKQPIWLYSWKNSPAQDLRESQMFGRMHNICNERGSPIPNLSGWLVLLSIHDWTGNQLQASQVLIRIGSAARGSRNLKAVFAADGALHSETQRSMHSFTLLDHVLDGRDDHVDHLSEDKQFLNMLDSPDCDVELLFLDERSPWPPAPEPLDKAATVSTHFADPTTQNSNDVGDVDHLTGTDPTLVDYKEEDHVLLERPGPYPFPLSSRLRTAHGTHWSTTRIVTSLTSLACSTTTVLLMYDSQTRHVGGRSSGSLSTMGSRHVLVTCRQCNGIMSLAYCTCVSYHGCHLEYHTLCNEGLNIYYIAFNLTRLLQVHNQKWVKTYPHIVR